MTELSKYKRLILGISIFLLANSSLAAIYRPIDPAGLINAVQAANITPVDDIIDLQGNIITFADNCDVLDVDIDLNCTPDNALPIIAAQATGGRLSIINGTIERLATAANRFRLIETASLANLSLFNLSLRNGHTPPVVFGVLVDPTDNGGAIYNRGYLELQNSVLSNNTATDDGGAIYNAAGATLAIQSSNIRNNTAEAASSPTVGGGGGIFNAPLIADPATPAGIIETISKTTIDNNLTNGLGGGINNQGQLNHLIDSTISNNVACSEGLEDDTGFCAGSTGLGGGIYNHDDDDLSASTTEILQIVNTTISGNVAFQGGGIYIEFVVDTEAGINDDVPDVTQGVHIYNSTIAGNKANNGGGGIFANGNGSGNPDTGAVIDNLISTIVAGNFNTEAAVNDSPDIFLDASAVVTNENHNLIGTDKGNNAVFVNGVNNDIVGIGDALVDPELGELTFNGGFTETMALLPGSPAINQGSNPFDLFYDQRGALYRRVKCSRPDIGAFENQSCFLL